MRSPAELANIANLRDNLLVMATKIHIESQSPDYWKDPYGWAMFQAELIRAGRLAEIDLENVAEEIESVGRSEFRSLKSNLAQVLLHMLKWDYQPERRSRSWVVSIKNHRYAYKRDLKENPSLKPRREEARSDAYEDALNMAEGETHLPLKTFPTMCPYDWSAILEQPYVWEGTDD
jgi:Domain of unknown function DUF29